MPEAFKQVHLTVHLREHVNLTLTEGRRAPSAAREESMTLDVYNLEFRHGCHEMTVGGYRFERVEDYETQLLGLQHLVDCRSEFSVRPCTGANQVTARVALPDPEPGSILPRSSVDATGLDDVLLLLSIFTGRQVFAVREERDVGEPRVLLADPRISRWSGVIQVSIPYEPSAPRSANDPASVSDNGLQIHLNRVYELMGTSDWRGKYRGGYFLFLFRTMLQERTIEAAFTQCWTLWEHLFSVLNDPWMADTRKATSTDKIAFLLVTHGVRERLQDKEKKRLMDLSEIRNRLVHYGRFPERSSVYDDALLFIHMTQWIVARTLGLQPSEAFDTLARFEQFITETACAGQRREPGGRRRSRQ